MTNINMIVAALDLEVGSNAVLARAVQLATAHDARLLIVHVVEAEPLSQVAALSGLDEGALQDALRQQAVVAIDALIADPALLRRVDVRIAFGRAHETITSIADEQRADIIIIGPGQRRSLKEKILGSTADRVIRTTKAPVLVVRAQSSEPYQNVAVAIDFSIQSAVAVQEARKLAPEAALQLIHAIAVPATFEQAMLRAGTPQAEIQNYRVARHDKARRDLAEFVRSIAGIGKVKMRVADNEPGPALVRLSKAPRVDLVAIGPHGRGAVHQTLLGSVTRRILNEAGCDVLVANSR